MATALKLNLDEVRSLLGLSTDSILNHINKGTLKAGKVNNKGEDLYVFELIEVKDFAKEYLDMLIEMPEKEDDNTSQVLHTENSTDEIIEDLFIKQRPRKNKAVKKDQTEDKESIFAKFQKSYMSVMKQLADYKEQAAFRIGQLEGELSTQRKLLTDGQHEIAEKEKMIRRLKIELKKTKTDLEVEKNMIDKMSLFDRIFKKKKY